MWPLFIVIVSAPKSILKSTAVPHITCFAPWWPCISDDFIYCLPFHNCNFSYWALFVYRINLTVNRINCPLSLLQLICFCICYAVITFLILCCTHFSNKSVSAYVTIYLLILFMAPVFLFFYLLSRNFVFVLLMCPDASVPWLSSALFKVTAPL